MSGSRNPGARLPIGYRMNEHNAKTYKMRTNGTGFILISLTRNEPATKAPVAGARAVNGPNKAMLGLTIPPANDPIKTAIVPKNGPRRKPIIAPETRPKEITPPPPMAML